MWSEDMTAWTTVVSISAAYSVDLCFKSLPGGKQAILTEIINDFPQVFRQILGSCLKYVTFALFSMLSSSLFITPPTIRRCI
jgi:hypothetical protein